MVSHVRQKVLLSVAVAGVGKRDAGAGGGHTGGQGGDMTSCQNGPGAGTGAGAGSRQIVCYWEFLRFQGQGLVQPGAWGSGSS